tara:strand:- start:940 stop:1104 length:165 start_codon:yes stop_codon:yes gene_type:complete
MNLNDRKLKDGNLKDGNNGGNIRDGKRGAIYFNELGNIFSFIFIIIFEKKSNFI